MSVLALQVLGGTAASVDFQILTECSSPDPAVFCIIAEPAISPDGQCLAFTDGTTWPPHYEWWPSIVVTQIGGSGCAAATPIVAATNNWHHSPAWSPDGSRLAFVSEGWDAEKNGLWTVDPSDAATPPNSLRQIASGGDVRSPAWSLDGSSIAFARSGAIYVVPSSGGAPTLVTADGWHPSWGPDGQIAFVRAGDLWIRDLDGKDRQLTDTPENEADPAWSPQGRWLAYASNRAGSWDIWIIATSGGTPVQLTSDPADQLAPSWSAAADRLVFASTLNDHDRIWLATDLPDWTTPVSTKTWSALKQLYR